MNNNIENTNNLTQNMKKRGRKSKKELEQKLLENNENTDFSIENMNIDIQDNIFNEDDTHSTSLIDNKPVPKKRGRKPKGGKIIQQVLTSNNNNKENRPNVILHLKCFYKDLNENHLLSSNLDSFNFSNPNLSYDVINKEDYTQKHLEDEVDYESEPDNVKDNDLSKVNDIREIWRKLKILEHDLHINNITNKKCACFYDTCEFDNPPIYIPKFFMNGTYHVYGCFCSPECAVAFLMKEQIDTSTKFERYYLLNNIYSKIFEYKKNIKPAADPFYMLDKFYGNLTIQEYRSLLRNERLFLIVDKPLTRIMPELHEDNDDFIINNKIIPSNTYQIKKRLQKKQTKHNILNERFGLSTN